MEWANVVNVNVMNDQSLVYNVHTGRSKEMKWNGTLTKFHTFVSVTPIAFLSTQAIQTYIFDPNKMPLSNSSGFIDHSSHYSPSDRIYCLCINLIDTRQKSQSIKYARCYLFCIANNFAWAIFVGLCHIYELNICTSCWMNL